MFSQSDVIIGLGCHDVRVAERSADLFLEGLAPWLLFTCYLGNQTAGQQDTGHLSRYFCLSLSLFLPMQENTHTHASTHTYRVCMLLSNVSSVCCVFQVCGRGQRLTCSWMWLWGWECPGGTYCWRQRPPTLERTSASPTGCLRRITSQVRLSSLQTHRWREKKTLLHERHLLSVWHYSTTKVQRSTTESLKHILAKPGLCCYAYTEGLCVFL